jgi:dipeptidase D
MFFSTAQECIFLPFNLLKMSEEITSLQPQRIWHYFNEILQVPRPSKKEEKIATYVKLTAKKLNFEVLQDNTGNILVRKPAYPGYENTPGVILQGHLDMVCEKNTDKEFDFDNDAIEAYVDGEWLKARGTTLGADDGIGMALMLAVLESNDLVHGPLECLFTVDEETGLTGAFGLEPGFLQGKVLLNLDSEDDGEFFIGCAGGRDTVIELPFKTEAAPEGYCAFDVSVSGLTGGHSGDDIHKGRANANKLLNRLLWDASNTFHIRLASFEGGNLRNAIAREAHATVLIPDTKCEDFQKKVKTFEKFFRKEYHVTEPDLSLKYEKCNLPGSVLAISSQIKLLNSLYACPHGVIAMSQDIPGFVETSTNLASIKMKDGFFRISTSQRSSVESAKDDICAMVAAVFSLAGGRVEQGDGYPGWSPDPDSRVVELAVEAWESLYKEKPVVRAVHAGLECGLIGDKYPGMDMISYGPTLRGVHSPDERLEIPTVQKFWDLTVDLLKRIAEGY